MGDNVSVRRHTSYNLIGSLIPLGLSLLTVPIYLKLVGPDRYGVLAIAWLLLGYFGLFDLGLGRATSYRIAALQGASPAERANTFWAALTVNLGMGLVGGAALWIAATLFFARIFKVDADLRPELLHSVPMLAASVPIATLTGVLSGALQGRQKFLNTNAVSVVSTALFQLFPLGIAVVIGPNLIWLLAGALAARLLAVIALAYMCHREITAHQPRRFDKQEIKALLRYGGWVTMTSIFGPMLLIIDRFIIGAVLGAVAVTIYTVPVSLAQRMAILPSALTTALFPRMSAADPAQQRILGDRAMRTLASLLALPFLGTIFIIEPFLRVWVGADIGGQAGPLGRILLIGYWANGFALIPFTRLQASGRPDIVTKVLLAEIPPHLAFLYFAIHHLGLWGIALALTTRFVVDFLLLSWAAGKSFDALPVLIPNFIMLIAASQIAGLWPISDWRWWAAASVFGIIGCALSWKVMPTDTKAELLGRLRQALGRTSAFRR